MSLRVLLAGGGSGGSATPVLAVAQALRRRAPSVEFLYVGTRQGPEAALAAAQGIQFAGVESGKFRRYWDPHNLTDPGRVAIGVAQAYRWARRFRPRVAFAAGGFGAVAFGGPERCKRVRKRRFRRERRGESAPRRAGFLRATARRP